MKSAITNQLVNKITFLVGNKKNAGKTTFLNYALKQVRKVVNPTFFTIGIDGETSDLIYDTPKPKIYTEIGDFVITSNLMINKSDALFDIFHVFPYKTVLGRLVLAKTLRSGTIELVGAEDNKQITEIIEYLKNEEQIKTIIIDGAASRATQVASIKNSNFYYIIKLDHKSINSDINKFKTIALISKFKSVDDILDVETKNVFEIKGALTASKLLSIPENCDILVLNDFTKIFLDFSQILELTRKFEIAYKIPYQLISFVVILKDIKKEDFKKILKQHNIEETILYNPYEN
ncbi:hypothetical protein [Lutibacter sp.]|uniref:hypothetical protein n=1 Tax=Lutibacter sp. TaxID=1925666 RepID=UPI00356B04F4